MNREIMNGFHSELEKIAASKLRVGEVEDYLGAYLPDKLESQARGHLQGQIDKSFALRHPILTGIPTLGIAPAMARDRAIEAVATRLMRDNKDLRATIAGLREQRHKQRMEELERTKAERAVRAGGEALGDITRVLTRG